MDTRTTTSRRRAVLVPAAMAALGGLGAIAPVRAQEATPESGDGEMPATVSVSGQGVVNVPPDTASVTVGIDVIRPDLGEAQTEANRQATDIINAVKSEGVDAKDIQTTNYSVNILRNYNEGADPTQITGFEVMNQVNVTIRDIGGVGRLMNAVVAAGANSIYGVSFFVDDPKPFSAEARKLAVDDARVKAEQLAEAAGMRVGRVMTISEDSNAYYPGPMYPHGAPMTQSDAAIDVPVETGTSAITVNVQMTFELE
jgi:uncharacterized protein